MPSFTFTKPTRPLPALAAIAGGIWLLNLSVFPPSSTRIDIWPWAAIATLGWLFIIVTAIIRLAANRPASRFGGWLDSGLLLLAVTAIASALLSPLRGIVLPHVLPVVGACALPYLLLPALTAASSTRTLRLIGGLTGFILLTSLVLWIEPWNGLSPSTLRNAEPFGHANITGSFAVLATIWMSLGVVRETGRVRGLFLFGVGLSVVTALSSGSRGAVLALAATAATAATISLLRRGRVLLFIVLLTTLLGAVLLSNARLRDLAFHGRWSPAAKESNDQRTAMIVGGLRLGAERPWLGWGPGSIPHVFPRVRADLPGTADNVLQLHNSPVQLWATLGLGGLLAAAFIAIGITARLRAAPWTPERIALVSGLAGTLAMLLFDHPFATPACAILAAAVLTVACSQPKPKCNPLGYTSRRLILFFGALLLIPVLIATARDLAARSAHDNALDRASHNDPAGYIAHLRRASALAPADPYYAHLIATCLATGHPFPAPQPIDPAAAIPLLTDTLEKNPDLEYARYNLGWLLLESDPAAAAFNFSAAARLAPQRGAVYFGLGLARIRINDTDGAVRAFATEWLLNPSFAWSPVWFAPPLDALRARIHALAGPVATSLNEGADPWSSLADAPATPVSAYRRLRTGYGVLMGHPEGPPPIDVNLQEKLLLPDGVTVPPFGWLDGGVLLDFLKDSPH